MEINFAIQLTYAPSFRIILLTLMKLVSGMVVRLVVEKWWPMCWVLTVVVTNVKSAAEIYELEWRLLRAVGDFVFHDKIDRCNVGN